MALTLSPYATGFPSDSLNTNQLQNSPLRSNNHHHMSRAVSINMDSMGGGDNRNEQEYVEGLDDMVASFGDPMGSMVDPDLQNQAAGPSGSSHMQPPLSMPPQHQPSSVDDMFHNETGLEGGSDDDDDDSQGGPSTKRRRETQDVPGGFTYVDKEGETGRRKIRIEYITDKSRRHITFSKRKAGIMKKAYELSILTGTQVLLLVVSETGLVYTFTTTKLQPLVTKAEGKNLIQSCLSAPDGVGPDGQPLGGPVTGNRIKSGPLAIRPHKLTPEVSKAMMATAAQVAGATPDEAEAQANAQAHANAQAKSMSGIGNGTPTPKHPGRRISRLPSSARKRAASGHSAGAEIPQAPELMPPVPPIPDMHRQQSPSTHLLPHGQPPTPNPLHSPLSAGYHMPPEYQHPPHPHGMASPTYAYPPTPTQGDYGVGQPLPGYGGYPQGPPHQNFLVHPGMYQGQHQPQPTEPRRMMPGPGDTTPGGMRMGM